MNLPPLNLNGTGGAASARTDATNSGGIGSAPWIVNFASEPAFTPTKVVFRADAYGMPSTATTTGASVPTVGVGLSPGAMLLAALALVLVMRKG